MGSRKASPNALEAERLPTLLRLAAERRWCDSFLAGAPPDRRHRPEFTMLLPVPQRSGRQRRGR